MYKGASQSSLSRRGMRTPRYGKQRKSIGERPLPSKKELAERKARRES